MGEPTTRYCIDTSSLIDAQNFHYPPDHFPGLWDGLAEMAADGRLTSPWLVREELLRGKLDPPDFLQKWAVKQKAMFLSAAACQEQILEVMAEVSSNNPDEYISEADPWVIALAMAQDATVVTSESYDPKYREKIPQICKRLSVPCERLIQLVKREAWVFR